MIKQSLTSTLARKLCFSSRSRFANVAKNVSQQIAILSSRNCDDYSRHSFANYVSRIFQIFKLRPL